MSKRTKSTDTRSVQERRNSGYWDGVAARERGNRWPLWNKSCSGRCAHPFDKPYGEGFWIGWYNEPAPKGAVL